jgi:hypothetical protein
MTVQKIVNLKQLRLVLKKCFRRRNGKERNELSENPVLDFVRK